MEKINIIDPDASFRIVRVLASVMAPVNKGPLFINGVPHPISRSKEYPFHFEVTLNKKMLYA